MKEQFKTVKLSEVQKSKTNPRKSYDNAALKELAESIKQHGIIQPLIVRAAKKGFELVSGSRRLRAAKEAKLKEVPVIVKDLSDEDVIEIQIIENLQRQDIHPLDEAEGFKNLIDSKKYTIETIAEKVGKSNVYVYQRMKLNNLIPEVKKLFSANHCSYGQAAVIARLLPDLQKKLYSDKYGNEHPENVNLGDIKRWIFTHTEKDLSKARFKTEDTELLPKAGACKSCPKNTACDHQLFPDYADKKICMDPKCFEAKTKVFLEKKYAEIKQKDDKALKITTSYSQDSNQPDVLSYSKYSECKKTDKGARLAIVVGGYNDSDIGKVKYVTTETISSGSGSRVGPGKSLDEKIKEARGKNNNIVRIEALAVILNAIKRNNSESRITLDSQAFSPEIRRLFLKMAFAKIDHDTLSKLKNTLKWDVTEYKKENYIAYDKFLEDYFIKPVDTDLTFIYHLLWALLASDSLSPCCYRHYEDKFNRKDFSDDLRLDFIYELSELLKFDYPGKLKELNDKSVAKLKEKSKPVKKSAKK